MKLLKYFGTLLLLLLQTPNLFADTKYPEHWWRPVIRDSSTPTWEILPQEAGPGEVIVSKRNELGILSNFAATMFLLERKKYASVEGLWQSMKYPENEQDPRATYPQIKWPFTRAQVEQMTAFEAKEAGDQASLLMKKMNIDWVSFNGEKFPYHTNEKGTHYKIIRSAMWEKLKQNPKVAEILLATGNLSLRPDHQQESNSPPAWKYCEIWMEIRSQLQLGQEHD